MQRYSRREILRMGAMLAAGAGLGQGHGQAMAEGLEKLLKREQRVLWLQGMSCTGCSCSLLNTQFPGPLELLTEIISLVYHQTLSAIQGEGVNRLIQTLVESGDYFLVMEGAIPLDMPEACMMGGRPLAEVLKPVAQRAKAIIAAGTCSAFGGIPAAEGNATNAASLQAFMTREGIPVDKRLIHCPGCPVHPESLLATLSYAIAKGYPEVDPILLTPRLAYKNSVHDDCPRFHYWEKRVFAQKFGDDGCLFQLGCLGPLSHTDCPRHQWNGGVNWCVRAGAPCLACTSESFSKKRDFPFYRKGEAVHAVAYQETDRRGAKS